MEKIFNAIEKNPLFTGIAPGDFKSMLNCLSARMADFKKNEVILLSGNPVNFVGLVLSGSVQVIKEDKEGNTTILTELGASEIFGETFACAGVNESPVTVLAALDTSVLTMDYRKIITLCSSNCPFHAKLIENMLKVIALKNIMLNRKIEILSKRSTREKIMCFLEAYMGEDKIFTIPYNREELASYLCVDRSAMSNELSKMRNEGIIDFYKNRFEIL
ncbi:MAG: Crp/Fnr family transcriptional regulator [Clostridiales bacterium]|nr:Crp/Fnr family transcriptional regulator [Clostridiales bacterium]